MKPRRRLALTACVALGAGGALAGRAHAQASAAASAAASGAAPDAAEALPSFAVEIRTGPSWDAKKPPNEQALFREHSAHLRKLREEGRILLGARYSDKGLLVVSATDIAAVRALFDADPSIKAGTFAYEAHPLGVFYGGCVQAPRRRG
jgi:uncharacterized protein YciI